MTYEPRTYWPKRFADQGLLYVTRGGKDFKFFREQADAFFTAIDSLKLPPCRLLLDFGCGVGRLAGALHGSGTNRYVGVDIVAAAIAKARAEYKDWNGVDFWTVTDHFPEEADLVCVDRLVAITVFQHMPDPDLEHWAAEFRRVGDPGLEFVIIDDTGPRGEQTAEHVFRRSPDRIAEVCGFEIVAADLITADHKDSHVLIHGRRK